ncbi:MAG: Na(+)-translocating NADH-quinone reductase subunit A [Crocinitomicaceae bacterium]|nr:Na(+)-translocating NADH-quinone reductase subunit A [Crocinitomicaceae bacterium]MDG1659509.1 Na(+)-translocating NADH-quinone reductase subunit A [Crocinitomicaceae bacterium]MDG2440215.1 Na(+)-translocating NADH-quinone reductase subunit A [Crocinitomicaceae bacterium]
MSKSVKLRKGLDIRLVGEAEKVSSVSVMPKSISIKPTDFHQMIPKMVVKEGDAVKAGTILFHDKYNPSINYASTASGKVKSIVRGAKRRILEVLIETDGQQTFEVRSSMKLAELSNDQVKEAMLSSGLWPFLRQRPLDVVANPSNEPKAIFVSAFDSSPLAPDFNYVLHGKNDEFQAGLAALSKLTSGTVHLTMNGKTNSDETFKSATGVQLNSISGKHPAGNVGTQIHHIDPINKGEFVWTVNAQDVALIGRFFLTGKFDMRRTIALTGSEIKTPQYTEALIGANVSDILNDQITSENVRVISGNVLTGEKIEQDGYLGFYHNQITVIPEGDQLKFVATKGWMSPGFDKFSNSRTFPTWILPKSKKFRLDTNTNGEERAFVVTGELEKVFPFDILPMQLVKAAVTDDIDGMENLGIYEVAPEDFALCEYVCTSKINIQDKIRQGLDLIASECM